MLPKKSGIGSGGTHFVKKIHAEWIFYPILMQLDTALKLSEIEPAFVGGVKTPCRTCAMVLDDATRRLGKKLIVPTNAFGHYWGASGMRVPRRGVHVDRRDLVFGEMPPSPEH